MEFSPKFLSTRVVFTLILFGGVVLFQNFAASYTSFLSVVTLYEPFENVETLYKLTKYTVGTRAGSALHEMFKVKLFDL